MGRPADPLQGQVTEAAQPNGQSVTSASPSSATTANGNGSDAVPSNAAQLPPEALALASKLFNCARSGDLSTLTTYLNAGIPPNLTNHSGDTLLMLSSYHNHPSVVTFLLSKGADPNVLNDRGQSPLAGAIFKGYDEVVRILVEDGRADIRKGKPTPVETAAMFGRYEVAKIMGVEQEVRDLEKVLNPVAAGRQQAESST